MYQNIIQQITKYDTNIEYGKKAFEGYIEHARLFKHLMSDEEEQEQFPQELDTIKP